MTVASNMIPGRIVNEIVESGSVEEFVVEFLVVIVKLVNVPLYSGFLKGPIVYVNEVTY
jgi:hypothetical protein